MTHWRFFLSLWRQHKAFGCFLVMLTVVSTAVATVQPLFFRWLIDSLSNEFGRGITLDEGRALRLRYLLILAGLGVFRLAAAFYPAFRARMNAVFERRLRQRYFDAVLARDYRFFVNCRTGDVVTRLTEDLSGYPNVAWFACSGFFRAFDSTTLVLSCIVAMVMLNWRLAGVALLPLPLALVIYFWISNRMRESYDASRKALSLTSNHIEACFSGIRILKAYDAEARESRRFVDVLEDRFGKELTVVRLSGKLHIFFQFVSHAAQVVVVLYGGLMVIDERLSLGDYYAFFTYLGFIVYPMLDLPNLLVTSRQAFVCVDRLEELRVDTVAHETPHGTVLRRLDGPIETIGFDGVGFSYDDPERPVLRDLTFTVRRGQRVAIVGQIASGKTTLLNLLSGILTPTTGQVLINGVPVSELDPLTYHQRLGYIGQEPVVFSKTVAQNIRFWRQGHERPAIEDAAALAQLRDEVTAFPDGFDQEVGQRGVTISGGQKQRLTIARAVLGTPELLIMDDVTASLDADSEEAFWRDMDQTYGRPTVFIVTHRLATARRADHIMVLKDGAIADEGAFDELSRRSEVFRRTINLD